MELQIKESAFIVSKTDLKGRIVYGNETFIEISGYSEYELLKSPHSILRHEDMPSVIFKLLWERIEKPEGIYAYVKNKTKNGDYYWVFAYVTPSFDLDRNKVGYYSVRRRPARRAIGLIESLYQELINAERAGGLNASESLLNQRLNEKGMTYDEFVFSLKK